MPSTVEEVIQWWNENVSEPDERGVRRVIIDGNPVYFRGFTLGDVLNFFNPEELGVDPLVEAMNRAAAWRNILWTGPGTEFGDPALEWPEDMRARLAREAQRNRRARRKREEV